MGVAQKRSSSMLLGARTVCVTLPMLLGARTVCVTLPP